MLAKLLDLTFQTSSNLLKLVPFLILEEPAKDCLKFSGNSANLKIYKSSFRNLQFLFF